MSTLNIETLDSMQLYIRDKMAITYTNMNFSLEQIAWFYKASSLLDNYAKKHYNQEKICKKLEKRITLHFNNGLPIGICVIPNKKSQVYYAQQMLEIARQDLKDKINDIENSYFSDYEMLACSFEDTANWMALATSLYIGDIGKAALQADHMDTYPREYIPNDIYHFLQTYL